MQSPLHLQQPSPKTLAREKFQDRDWGRRGLKEEGTRKETKTMKELDHYLLLSQPEHLIFCFSEESR